jgi:hypothetical protein
MWILTWNAVWSMDHNYTFTVTVAAITYEVCTWINTFVVLAQFFCATVAVR